MRTNNIISAVQNEIKSFVNKYVDTVYKYLEADNNKFVVNKRTKTIDIPEGSWGVYAFFLIPKTKITSVGELETMWNGNKSLKSPAVHKTHFKTLQPLAARQSACLYVGKSQGLLRERIEEHIHKPSNDGTYALRLSEHDQFLANATIKYSYFDFKDWVDDQYKDAKSCLLNILESRLHDKLLPLVGKK